MSCLQHTVTLNSYPSFDELRWVVQIRQTLDGELEDDREIPACIFNVPKALMSTDPDSYIPQQVAIGPYHYWRPELYEMERYKLAAAKRIQKQLQNVNFHNLADQLTKLEPMIRACYHKYLDFNGETLAWMMAIDSSFLLQFLQIYAVREGKVLSRVSSMMSHLVDFAGRKSAHNTILTDIVMLENQIPLFILRKMLEFQLSSLELADDVLHSMLVGLCKDISPFKMMENLPKMQFSKCAHLLDFLYHMIVPKFEEPSVVIEIGDQKKELTQGEESSCEDSSLANQIWHLLSKLNKNRPVCFLKRLLVSKPVKATLKLPWIIISNFPVFSTLKQPIEYLFFSQEKEETNPENESSGSNSSINKPPLVEEITIPSVTELSKSGVRFLPTNGGISTIRFDTKTVTFYLPTISLDGNTEVILRNLVAYEASSAPGPLVFTRYTELINGIIDTGEDAKLLREKRIILNRLKSDEEAANMCNGMSKSIRLTKVPFLDKVIEDVNKYYNSRLDVKAGKLLRRYVFGSWRFLTLLATILLLLLVAFRAFCSVYSCSRMLHFSVK